MVIGNLYGFVEVRLDFSHGLNLQITAASNGDDIESVVSIR